MVLGPGFGGTATASKLSEFCREKVRITIVEFHQPAYLGKIPRKSLLSSAKFRCRDRLKRLGRVPLLKRFPFLRHDCPNDTSLRFILPASGL